MEKIYDVFHGLVDFALASEIPDQVKGYITKLYNVILAAFGWGAVAI